MGNANSRAAFATQKWNQNTTNMAGLKYTILWKF